jgi:hypothetical protein
MSLTLRKEHKASLFENIQGGYLGSNRIYELRSGENYATKNSKNFSVYYRADSCRGIHALGRYLVSV